MILGGEKMIENKEEYIKKELKGIDPVKLKYAIEFTSNGLLKKSGEDIIKGFNFIFGRNENPSCKPCSISRYRNAIYSFVEYGNKVYSKYGINIQDELAKFNEEEPKEEVKKEKEEKEDVKHRNKRKKL